MTTFTDTFTGSPLQPSDVGYIQYTLAADKTLEWPSTASTGDIVARIMSVDCTGDYALIMPAANEAATGQDTLITNTGASTLTIKDNSGGTITTVLAGTAKYVYLTDNITVAGTWAAVAFGVGASNVDASALAGYGLLAVSTTLNQSCPVTTLNTPTTLGASDRARLNVDMTGVAVTLPSAAAAGNNFFTFIRNGGSGITTITPVGGDLIDTGATAALNPSESVMVICSGTAWYTVGWGRSVIFNYTQLTKNIAGGTDVTLTAAEAGYKILKFTGLLTANINVIVPSTTSIWYVDNATTGAFSVTVKTAAGGGIATTGGTHYILYGDGTNVVNAVTITGSFSSFAAGSASSPSITFTADTNTGAYNTAADQFGIAVNGTQVANFTASGLSLTPALTVASGGTNIASYAIGDIIYASGTTTLAKLADIATGNALITGGVGVAPSYGKIGLTTHITGTLAIGNGGTGATTASAALTALGGAALAGATFAGAVNLNAGLNTARGTVAMNATTMNLWAQPNVIDGTGSAVTITALTNSPGGGATRRLYPIAGTTITHGATFDVEGNANYTTIAGDSLEFESVTVSTYKVRIYAENGKAVIPSYTGVSTVTVATDDLVCIQDTSASGAPKVVTAQSIADLAVTSSTPAGIIFDFAGANAQIPAGYLGCDGSAVSRTTFATLFAAIGTLWGVGDGSTTFNLPNFTAGDASVQNAGTVGGNTNGQVIAHTHDVNFATSGAAGANTLAIGVTGSTNKTSSSTGGTKNLAGGRYVNKIIKT